MDNKFSESTAIKLYKRPDSIIPIDYPNNIRGSIEILELSNITFDELISYVTKRALLEHCYDMQDRPLIFLTWYKEYLFYYDEFTYNRNNDIPNYTLSIFFYTRMKDYKDVIIQTVFDEKCKICITKTTRPILTSIVDFIDTKKDSND